MTTFPAARPLFALCFALWATTALAQKAAPLSAGAQRQVEALQAEKAARNPAQQKLDSQLLYRVKKHRGEKLGAGLETMEGRVKVRADGTETVDIQGDVTPALLAELKAAGAEIVASVPRFRSVRARVPLGSVETLAARADVAFVKPAVQAMTHAGVYQSQGDVTMRADAFRSSLRATGRGMKVGILSDSISHLAASQASGDLGPVTILPGQDGLAASTAGEGTAMLEIVHDLAPDAELFFATAYLSEAQFAQNILDLRAAGCNIIVDDVGYFDESPFQDGPVAQAVDQVAADGALYFSAAGNEGNSSNGTSGVWEGDFADGGPTGTLFNKAGRLHDFGGLTYNQIFQNGAGATLFWSDPAGASDNDYDLYLLDSTGTQILAASTNTQNGHQDPYESVPTIAGARLVIVKSIGAQPRHLHLNTLRGETLFTTTGTIQGHPAAAGAFAVAAVAAPSSFPNPFSAANVIEYFSTDGDRRVFFHADGTPITPGNLLGSGGLVRPKPDLAAADGVMTSVPGFQPFYGTSAAAPHAGAVAALVWSRNRALTPQQVRTALLSTAIDIGPAGVDRESGAGIVNALAAGQSVTGGVVLQPGISAVVGESYTPANGLIDPGETVVVSVPLQNVGALAATNVTAALLTSGGVSSPSGPTSYGAIPVNGSQTRSFSFQANGAAGSGLVLKFALSDGATSLGTISVPLTIGTLGVVRSFSNGTAISIPSVGSAAPYPSGIAVSGVSGQVGKVTVTLNGFSHTYPSDVDVLLVSPSGRKVILMSDAGGDDTTPATGQNFTFDDAAEGPLTIPLASGTFQPTAGTSFSLTSSLGAPAPAQPYAGKLSAFQGDTPNGTWQLYVRDQFAPDAGSFSGGWSLQITPVTTPGTGGANPDLTPVIQQSTSQLSVGEAVTYTVTVYNNGPAAANAVVLTDTLPAGLTFGSATASQGTVSALGKTVTASLGSILAGQSATVQILAVGSAAGSATNTASVALTGTENSTANNSASSSLTVGTPNLAPVQPFGWSGSLVIANAPGVRSDAIAVLPTDTTYVDFAFTNAGTSPAHAYFKTELLVDGVVRRTFQRQLGLGAGATTQEVDISLGALAPGTHTVQARVDAGSNVTESNESDNVITRTFVVQGPNLTTFKPNGWSDRLVLSKVPGSTLDSASFTSQDTVYVDRALINAGALPTNGSFTTALYVDDVLRTSWTTGAPFASGAQNVVQDFSIGTLSAGVHTVRLVIDAAGAVAESDETDNSYTRTIVVNAVPTITGLLPQSLNEDISTGPLAFTVNDTETSAANLQVTAASSNPSVIPVDQIVVSGNAGARTVTITPALNVSGSSTITLTVSDGDGAQASTTFVVKVASVNDAPVFTKGADITVLEDATAQTIRGWAQSIGAGAADEAGQTLNFLVSNDNAGLFFVAPSIAADGTLTFTPARDANGVATVSVRLRDDGGTDRGGQDTSAVQTFTIRVLPVNDAPTLDAIAPLTITESAGEQDLVITGITSGAPNEVQTLTVSASTDNPGLIRSLQTDYRSADKALLSYTPTPGANGIATIHVTVDDGAAENHATTRSFTVTVLPVNDAPSFTAGGDVRVLEDSTKTLVEHWATSISPGGADEVGQILHFVVSTDHPEFFASPPAISPSGDLTFSVAPDANGTASVTATLFDNGGTANGGYDASATRSFSITVAPVNDAPRFTKGRDVSAAYDAGPQTISAWATQISAGPADESAQQLHFVVSADKPELFAAQPAISANGTLTFAPAPRASGTARVTVALKDDGGTADGGADASSAQTFQVHVTSIAANTGRYIGLIEAAPGETPENGRTGLVNLTISRTGRFTGRVTLLGRAYAIAGLFDNDGIARFGAGATPRLHLRPRGLPALDLTLQVDVTGETSQLTGALTTSGAPYAAIRGDRAVAPSTTVATSVSTMVGGYTVVFAGRTPTEQGLPTADFPQGHGVATLRLDARGNIRLAGTLADGTAISYASPIAASGAWPLYIPLFRGPGSISGMAAFRDQPGVSDVDAENLQWFRPARAAGRYANGWPNGIQTDLVGARFSGGSFTALTADDSDGNVQIAASDPTLATGLQKAAGLNTSPRVRIVQPTADRFVLTYNQRTGLFSGSFLTTGDRTRTVVRAAILPTQNKAFGYYLRPTTAGEISITPAASPVTSP